MPRYLAAPDDSAFMVVPDDGDGQWGPTHDDWVELDQAEYDRRLAAQRQIAEQRSAEFLRQARAPQLEAAQDLVALGLSPAHAAAVAGVPAAELEAARG